MVGRATLILLQLGTSMPTMLEIWTLVIPAQATSSCRLGDLAHGVHNTSRQWHYPLRKPNTGQRREQLNRWNLCIPRWTRLVTHNLYNNNAGAVSLTKNTKGNTCVKHIDVRHHYVRDMVEHGRIAIHHIPSSDNLADIFTKPLGRDAHRRACIGLRLLI